MVHFRKTTLSLVLVLVGTAFAAGQSPCSQGTEYRGCPACGSATSVERQQDNLLKNRDAPAEHPKVLTIEELRNPHNNNSYFANMAVEITGFVDRVLLEGPETCNCARQDLHDIHIEIVATPQEVGLAPKRVVVELTPRWEEKLKLDNQQPQAMINALKRDLVHQWVTFRGWLFYDAAHVDQAESTNPGHPRNWRATPWEIHPVTDFKVARERP